MILGIVGEKLAGKDEVGKYLISRYKAFYIKYSHILDEILTTLDIPISRENEILLGRGLRDNFNRNVLWQGMQKRLQQSDALIKAIGSIRMPDEYDAVKKLGAITIYITAPAEIRYQRFMSRHEKTDDGSQTLDEFISGEQGWSEINIPKLGQQCDYKIENSGPIEQLTQSIDHIITTLTSNS